MSKILFVCGSPNQTKMYHKIAKQIDFAECFFSYSYADGFLKWIQNTPIVQRTILGKPTLNWNLRYFKTHQLRQDLKAVKNTYDLFVIAQDISIPNNLSNTRFVLVQEGTVVPEDGLTKLIEFLGLPRYLGNTALVGLSGKFEKFFLASDGYASLFMDKGIDPNKLKVTGIPNFDDCKNLLENDFPYHGYALVATSCLRENYKYENRMQFLRKVKSTVGDQEVIFKLHPRERVNRASREIRRLFPDALIFSEGNTDHMIANCESLFTKYSSVLLVAAALGKTVYADLDQETIRRLSPVQNNGQSASLIAEGIRALL